MGVELVLDRDEKTAAKDLVEGVFYRVLDGGLSFKISLGNVKTITLPLVLSREELDFSLEVIDTPLTEAKRGQGLA